MWKIDLNEAAEAVLDAERGGVPERVLDVARDLALARDASAIQEIVRREARALIGCDGVTFIVREGDLVHYAEEDAIAPLWKGRRFRAEACISGWAMLHRQPVVIEDIESDARIPHEAYRPTFVKSLAMVPIGREDPVAAIGAYWARRHLPPERALRTLETIAGFAAVAYANQALHGQLRRELAARDEFLSVVAHELRTPVAALRLNLGMLLRRIDQGRGGVTRDFVARVDRTAGRLASMVDVLLDVGRSIEAHGNVERTHVDLAQVVRSVLDSLSPADAALVRLEATDAPGSWDRSKIEQIVQNLVSNALKFGEGKPIDVRVALRGDEAVLVVRDSGIGIAPADAGRIFERFERAVSARHYGGFGVGLWLVRRNAEAHGGRVAVDSVPGEGATFTVVLPRA